MPEPAGQAKGHGKGLPGGPCADCMDPAMVPVLRAKSPAERLAMVDAMWHSAREMVLGMVRAQHPEWTTDRVEREAARRLSHGAV